MNRSEIQKELLKLKKENGEVYSILNQMKEKYQKVNFKILDLIKDLFVEQENSENNIKYKCWYKIGKIRRGFKQSPIGLRGKSIELNIQGIFRKIDIENLIISLQNLQNCFIIDKPPLGVKPLFIHQEERLKVLHEAIKRYKEAKQEIPQEWVEEIKILELSLRNFYEISKPTSFNYNNDLGGQRIS